MALQRIRLDIEYEGTTFAGWQIQPGQLTVQGELERALAVVTQRRIRLVGAGRTDAGVHAAGQVAHADVPQGIDLGRLVSGLNALTPPDIVITAARAVAPAFHARRSAVARAYQYRIAGRPLALDRRAVWSVRPVPSLPRLSACARALPGVHDFVSFCVAKSVPKGTRCRVHAATWRRTAGEFRFQIVADRFVHGMVRSLVGTMVEVGLGRLQPADFETLLASGHRRGTGPTAPAHGLCLVRVYYAEDRLAV